MIGLPARAQRRTFSCTHARKHGCAIANSSRAHTNPRRRLIWTINRWAFARHRSIDRDVLGIIDHPSSWRLLSKRKKEKKKAAGATVAGALARRVGSSVWLFLVCRSERWIDQPGWLLTSRLFVYVLHAVFSRGPAATDWFRSSPRTLNTCFFYR